MLAAVPAVATDSDATASEFGQSTVYVSQSGTGDGKTLATPDAFTDVFTADGLAYSDVSTIYIVGDIAKSDSSNANLKVDHPVTITSADASKESTVSGYIFQLAPATGATGTYTFKDIALSDKVGETYNGYVIWESSDIPNGLNVTLDGIDVATNSVGSENQVKWTVANGAVSLRSQSDATSKVVAVADSTFTAGSVLKDTETDANALSVAGAKTLSIQGSTFDGYTRGVQIDYVDSVSIGTSTANTWVIHQTDSSKVINLGRGNDCYSSVTIGDKDSSVTTTEGTSYGGAALATSSGSNFTVTKLTTSMSMTVNSTSGITLKTAELKNGADLVIPEGTKAVLANSGTLTIGSGSALKVAGTFEIANASGASPVGSIVNNGTIALVDGVEIENLATTVKTVTAYVLTYTEGKNTDNLSGPTLVYQGESIDVIADAKEGYAVSKVWLDYQITASASGSEAQPQDPVVATYDESRGVYVLTIPTVASTSTLALTGVSDLESGACTVTYVPVDAQGNTLPGTQYVQGLEPSGTIYSTDGAVPTLVSAGYVFSGIWLESANATSSIDSWSTAATGTTVYGLMEKTYAINIADVSNGTVESSPADAAKKDAAVVLTITADDGYELSSIKVVDASGNTVSTKANFTMPASAVTVSVVFKQLHTVTVPAKTDATDDVGIWTIGTATNEDAAIAAEYVQGKTVTLSVDIDSAVDYALKTVAVTGASGAAVAVTPGSTEGTYTFKMPDEDVAVSYTYAPAYTITYQGLSGITLAVSTPTVKATAFQSGTTKVAVGTEVTVVATTSTENYTVKDFALAFIDSTKAVVPVLVSNVAPASSATTGYIATYTFAMPETAVNAISASAVQAYIVEKVEQAGAGNVKGPSDGYVSYSGEELAYTVLAADESALETITIVQTSDDANPYKYVYDVVAKELRSYASSNTTAAQSTLVQNQIIAASDAGYTITMQSSNVIIQFEFDDIVYYNVALADSTSDVELYTDYSAQDGFTGEVDISKKVAAGTYYIVVSQIEGKDVNNASATYTDRFSDYTGTTAVTGRTAGDKVFITLISQDAEQAVYTIALDGNTIIAAGYTDHYSTITVADGITNGKVALNDGTKDLESPASVKYGTVLTLAISDVTAGYVVDTCSATAGEIAYADGAYTYTVGMDDATISFAFAQGYAITVSEPAGISVSAPEGGVATRTITVTYSVEDGYELDTATAVYGAAAVEVSLTKVTGEDAYTFTMPAGDVAITFTSKVTGDQPVKATAVFVGISPGADGSSVVITGVGGYIPAGKVTVTAYYKDADNETARIVITIDVPEDTTKTYFSQVISTSDANASAVYAGSAVYVSDDGSFTASNAYTYLTAMSIAAATTQE